MDASPVGDPRTEDENRLLALAGPASDVAVGLLVGTTSRAVRVGTFVLGALRPVAIVVIRPPLVPERLQPLTWIQAVGSQGQDYRSRAEPWAQKIVPAVTAAIIEHIDIDAIVSRIDLDAIIAQIDVEALVDRIDVAALVRQVIEEIDLPALIRESSGAVASEAVVGIRMQSIQADERVSRIVDKVLLRRAPRKPTAMTQLEAGDAAAN